MTETSLESPTMPPQLPDESPDHYLLFLAYLALKQVNPGAIYQDLVELLATPNNFLSVEFGFCLDPYSIGGIKVIASKNNWKERKLNHFQKSFARWFQGYAEDQLARENLQRERSREIFERIYQVNLKVVAASQIALKRADISLCDSEEEKQQVLADLGVSEADYKPVSPKVLAAIANNAARTCAITQETTCGHELLVAKRAAEQLNSKQSEKLQLELAEITQKRIELEDLIQD